MDTGYTLQITVTKQNGWSGDVSIDDVVFRDGFCPELGQYCDFEQNLCNWAQSPSNDYDWIRTKQGKNIYINNIIITDINFNFLYG